MNFPKTIVFCALILTIPSFGWPAGFFVTTGDVSGLNDAINTANTNDEADTIHLEAGLYSILEYNPQDSQTYFHITSPISILGAGNVRTIIERNADFPFNFFLVDSLGELRLSGVTLSGLVPSTMNMTQLRRSITVRSGIIRLEVMVMHFIITAVSCLSQAA